MGNKIIETHVVPKNEEHLDVVERMRSSIDQVNTVYVTTSGWVMVRFRDLGLRIAGVLPLDLSWLSGISTDVLGFSTKPVDKKGSQHVDFPVRYELHLRLLPTEGDPHAIGHSFHESQALLQEPIRLHGKGGPRRDLLRTSHRKQRS